MAVCIYIMQGMKYPRGSIQNSILLSHFLEKITEIIFLRHDMCVTDKEQDPHSNLIFKSHVFSLCIPCPTVFPMPMLVI